MAREHVPHLLGSLGRGHTSYQLPQSKVVQLHQSSEGRLLLPRAFHELPTVVDSIGHSFSDPSGLGSLQEASHITIVFIALYT